MTGADAGGMPSTADPALIAGLRSVLAGAGYTFASVKAALGGPPEEVPLAPTSVPAALRRLDEGSPLATLVKLFVLGLPVEAEEIAGGLTPIGAEDLARLGLVTIASARRTVTAVVKLVPSGGLLLAHDRPSAAPRPDHVMGISLSSVLLANLTVRRRVERALDVGTGGGVQALRAAGHADHVVATDISPRALAFAAFNRELNAVGNVELRQGSFFEPVAGETFDLVVCNPPFVISPGQELLFRDGGLPGDELSRRLLAEAPAHLAEGGLAHILVSWGCNQGEHWSAPVRRWVEGNGCDAWVLHHGTQDALHYAAAWSAAAGPGADRDHESFDRWADHLQREGIDAVSTGCVILRRRTGRNWLRIDDLERRELRPAGSHIARLLEAEDRAERLSDDELVEQRFRLGPHHHLEQVLGAGSGRHTVERTTIVLDGGLPFRFEADPLVADLLTRMSGTRRLGDVVSEIGPDVVAAVREMVRYGVLVPAGE